ncbi:MAG: alpha/beta fold hydrolase [Helicobacter sp.]|nr:alpha/beta fold hydrolase [Helicobacteraceae bacterium]MDY3113939.1 alpha/beta fold hydrolase [Helicobacter sp.]
MAQKIISYKNEDFTLSYAIQNQGKKNTLIILHGWGANKNLMQNAFKDSFKDFTHYYIDLPGFGDSKIPPFTLNTQDYANIIMLLLESLKLQAKVCNILGHSFGGKVATLLNPKELILLSSAGIKTKKSLKTRLKIYITKTLNKLAPALSKFLKNFLRSQDAQNLDEIMYQTFKRVVDEDFSEIFANFTNKAYIFWGKSDLATPLKSGEKIANLIKDSTFFPLDGDHFFFLKQAKTIESLYLKAKAY